MSKDEQARVRDELLQTLYRDVLRCEAAGAGDGAAAAGVCAVLQPTDLLLLPARGAAGFGLLRPENRMTLPESEADGVYATLQLAGGLPAPSLVCVVLPAKASLSAALNSKRRPETWSGALARAARKGLPLLLVGGRPEPPPDPAAPAAAYPAIPVDKEDALAVYRVTHECAARARLHGGSTDWGGPSRIVPVPFRVRGAAAEPGALARLEEALRRRGAFSKAWHRQIERELAGQASRP